MAGNKVSARRVAQGYGLRLSLLRYAGEMGAATDNGGAVFIELGAAIVGLAILARIANRLGFSAIPLYLVAGLAFGNGGLAPLPFSKEFVHTGAEIGVLLLLFMLGLEHTGE